MPLPTGVTVSSGVNGAGNTIVYYTASSNNITIGEGVDLAAAKTSATDYCNLQITNAQDQDNANDALIAAYAGVPDSTSIQAGVLYNEYIIAGVLYGVPDGEEATATTDLQTQNTTLALAVTWWTDVRDSGVAVL